MLPSLYLHYTYVYDTINSTLSVKMLDGWKSAAIRGNRDESQVLSDISLCSSYYSSQNGPA